MAIILAKFLTQAVTLVFPDSHTERIRFHIFKELNHEVISGQPWIKSTIPRLTGLLGESLFGVKPVTPGAFPDLQLLILRLIKTPILFI